MAIFVYSMCALLRHFASTFNIFSFFAYQKKKGLNRIIEIMLMAIVLIGIPFISLRPFGRFVQRVLRVPPLTYYNLIGYQCVVQTVLLGRSSALLFFLVV